MAKTTQTKRAPAPKRAPARRTPAPPKAKQAAAVKLPVPGPPRASQQRGLVIGPFDPLSTAKIPSQLSIGKCVIIPLIRRFTFTANANHDVVIASGPGSQLYTSDSSLYCFMKCTTDNGTYHAQEYETFKFPMSDASTIKAVKWSLQIENDTKSYDRAGRICMAAVDARPNYDVSASVTAAKVLGLLDKVFVAPRSQNFQNATLHGPVRMCAYPTDQTQYDAFHEIDHVVSGATYAEEIVADDTSRKPSLGMTTLLCALPSAGTAQQYTVTIRGEFAVRYSPGNLANLMMTDYPTGNASVINRQRNLAESMLPVVIHA